MGLKAEASLRRWTPLLEGRNGNSNVKSVTLRKFHTCPRFSKSLPPLSLPLLIALSLNLSALFEV